jgi:hypothetical protein
MANVAIIYVFQYAINNIDCLFSTHQTTNTRLEAWTTIGILGYIFVQNIILYKVYIHFQSKRVQVHTPTIIGLMDDFGTGCNIRTAQKDPIQTKTQQVLIRYTILATMILDILNYVIAPIVVAIITIDTAIVHNIMPVFSVQIIIALNIILIDNNKYNIGLDIQSLKTAYNIAKKKGCIQ